MALNKDKAAYGRWRSAARRRQQLASLLTAELSATGIACSAREAGSFRRWMMSELWKQYQQHCMDQRNIYQGIVDSAPLALPNATKGKVYSQGISLPAQEDLYYDFSGFDKIGLEVLPGDKHGEFVIQGTPKDAGDFTVSIDYTYPGWEEGMPMLCREIHFIVNPDPRSLWRNIPTPEDVPFYKPDTAIEYVKVESRDGKPRKDIVAASNRGRSHAQEGKARDDHFRLHYGRDNGWYVIAVADGAGSAKYSRKGSQLACDTIVDFCIQKLEGNAGFESAIAEYYAARNDQAAEAGARTRCGHLLYSILVQGAYNAHKAINELSLRTPDTKPRDFSTTLMVAICKRFDFGWFFGTFWIGDGAVCIYDKENQSFALLGTPDEGEYSGQTRFLTMPEIFRDSKGLYQRLRFGFRDDFTALMLMTDGVSDPMFGTDANLANIERWNRLWSRLAVGFPEDGIGGVELTDDNEASAQQLLDWLNFWIPGEHDDRTLAILY